MLVGVLADEFLGLFDRTTFLSVAIMVCLPLMTYLFVRSLLCIQAQQQIEILIIELLMIDGEKKFTD